MLTEWYFWAGVIISMIPVTWYFFKLGAFTQEEAEPISDDEVPSVEIKLDGIKSITINY